MKTPKTLKNKRNKSMTTPFQNQAKIQRQETSTKLQKTQRNENKNAKKKKTTKQNVFCAFEFYKRRVRKDQAKL